MVIALPATEPSASASARLGLWTAPATSHSRQWTAPISQELMMGQALEEPLADVTPLSNTKVSDVGTKHCLILPMRKLRLREVTWLTQGDAAGGRRAVSSFPGEEEWEHVGEEGVTLSRWKGHTGGVISRHTLTQSPQAHHSISRQKGAHLSSQLLHSTSVRSGRDNTCEKPCKRSSVWQRPRASGKRAED